MTKIKKQVNNGIKLFEYLEQLSLLNINVRKSIKKLNGEEEKIDLENEDFLPNLDKIFLRNRTDGSSDKEKYDGAYLHIERYKISNTPKLPKELSAWIDIEMVGFVKPEPKETIYKTEYFDDDKKRIEAFNKLNDQSRIGSILQGWVTKNPDTGEYEKIAEREIDLHFKDYPELKTLFDNWIESKWKPWRDKNIQYHIANQAYDKLYALRSFLKTESDSYDLLWSHDVLTWKQGNTEIYHPTLFTPVEIDFDPNRNIISIKSDINSKTFFDVSFVREVIDENNQNRPDIDELAEKINKKIQEADFDVWDFEMIHYYMQQLVRYITPDGESKYNKRDQELEITNKPTSFNIHHLLLLKKSGKTWAEYAKKIQEDIKNNEKLTPFLSDLVTEDGASSDDGAQDDENNEVVKSEKIPDSELYFPLPYNEEQKRIAVQMDTNYGSVVQGPPGTGKTHTIANLISRFLAQGKTVLVTSQTGQALSVLKNKIPKEIRSLAVSQVESASRNNDLQLAVSEINATLSDKVKFTPDKKKKKEKELQEIRKQIAKKNNEFESKSLIDSKEVITIGSEKFTPISAAKFCAEFQMSDEFKMLDDIKYDDELAISQRQINDYISALESSNGDVWDFINLDQVPEIEKLPQIEVLKKYFKIRDSLDKKERELFKFFIPTREELERLDEIKEDIKKFFLFKEKAEKFKKRLKDVDFFQKNEISEAEFFSGDVRKYVENLLTKKLEIMKKILVSFNEEYEKELFKTLSNNNHASIWHDTVEKIDNLINQFNNAHKKLIGNIVNLMPDYEIDYISALEIISKIKERSGGEEKIKKGVSILFDFSTKKFIKNVKINNKEIETIEDLELVKAYFAKEKIAEELKNIWEQAFENLRNKKEFPEPFNIVEFEELFAHIKRIVNFENDYTSIKKTLENYKLFKDIDIRNVSFIEKALEVFDGYLSCFKVDEYKKLVTNISKDFEKESAHEKVLELAKKIKEMKIDEIDNLKEEILSILETREVSVEYNKFHEEVYNDTIKQLKENKNNHKKVIAYLQSIETGDFEYIKSFYAEIPDLIDSQNKAKQIKLVEDELGKKLQKTISKIRLSAKNGEDVEFDIEENWKWKRLINWLDKLHSGDSLSKISKDLSILKNKERDVVRELVQILAWIHLKDKVTKPQKEALASFAESMRQYGMGGGIHAPRHLRNAKNALKIGANAVPVWIMPVNTVHQLFPDPKAGMFDVVIFDEASQVDIRGLNIAYIGKKLLVVGDDEQVTPPTFVKQNQVVDLIARYIPDIPNSQNFTTASSLFSITKIKMTEMITLTEHFRSIEEIIGFSNSLSYKGSLKILRDQLPKYRLEPVLETVFVENGFEETNGKINKPEAEALVEKLQKMLKDDRYKETDEEGETRPITFGIISLLGKDQQKYIIKLISENISSKEIERRKIACGDSYTFQGDERDIILLSMVKSLNQNDPAKAISPLTVNKKENKQRINVAMSRAKNKMILFHSIPKDKLSNQNDLRKMILDWFYNRKIEERKAGLQAIKEEVERGRASEFEYEVAKIIIEAGYKVIPQYEVAGYRIDLVVHGENAKLAIECDGDKYHNRIEAWQEDIERQQILERAGWVFWRLSGSAFYKNGADALSSLWKKLDELAIGTKI